jgi:YD repeat-containing protein
VSGLDHSLIRGASAKNSVCLASALHQNTTTPSIYSGSTLVWNNGVWTLTRKDGTQMLFGANSFLTSIVDRNGNAISLARDQSTAQLSLISSPKGRWISLTYDSSGRIVSAQDNIGRTTSYTYNSNGRLQTVVDANNGTTSYAYDSAGRMYSFTTPNGDVYAKNVYDSNNRVIQQNPTRRRRLYL